MIEDEREAGNENGGKQPGLNSARLGTYDENGQQRGRSESVRGSGSSRRDMR